MKKMYSTKELFGVPYIMHATKKYSSKKFHSTQILFDTNFIQPEYMRYNHLNRAVEHARATGSLQAQTLP